MNPAAVLLVLAQLSPGPSYASAAIWFFGGLVLVALGIILVFEGLDALQSLCRSLWRRLRGDRSVAELAEDLRESELEQEGEGLLITEPDSKLRRRHYRRMRPIRRTWEGSHVNETSKHWRGRTSW